METILLEEAAAFLKMNAEVLRRKAKTGNVPGRKVGKQWVFVKEHLADFISGRYPDPRRNFEVIDGGKQQLEGRQCQSISAVKIKRGGLISPATQGSEYAALLAPKTSSKRKNCTTI